MLHPWVALLLLLLLQHGQQVMSSPLRAKVGSLRSPPCPRACPLCPCPTHLFCLTPLPHCGPAPNLSICKAGQVSTHQPAPLLLPRCCAGQVYAHQLAAAGGALPHRPRAWVDPGRHQGPHHTQRRAGGAGGHGRWGGLGSCGRAGGQCCTVLLPSVVTLTHSVSGLACELLPRLQGGSGGLGCHSMMTVMGRWQRRWGPALQQLTNVWVARFGWHLPPADGAAADGQLR